MGSKGDKWADARTTSLYIQGYHRWYNTELAYIQYHSIDSVDEVAPLNDEHVESEAVEKSSNNSSDRLKSPPGSKNMFTSSSGLS